MNFTDEQQAFINAAAGQSIVLTAAAGSGKTATVIARSKRLASQIEAGRLAVITYTQAAKKELKTRGAEGLNCTIHGLARHVLRENGFRADSRGLETIKFLAEYRGKEVDYKKVKAHHLIDGRDGLARQFTVLLGNAWREDPSGTDYIEALPDTLGAFKAGYKALAGHLLAERVYPPHMELIIALLAAQRGLLNKGRMVSVLIDEAQDISPLVFAAAINMIDWTAEDAALTLIGDKRQAIFGFADGASDIMELWQQAEGVATMELSQSFRIPQRVAGYAYRLGHEVKTLIPGGTVINGGTETFPIINHFLMQRKTVAWLDRTREGCKQNKAILDSHDIPSRYSIGSVANRKSVKLLIELESDINHLIENMVTGEPLLPGELMKRLPFDLPSKGLRACVDYLRDKEPAINKDWSIIQTLLEAAEDTSLSYAAKNYEELDTSGKVLCTTIHKAKGCEYDLVIMMRRNNEHDYKRTEEGVAEEVSLEYVALTRCKDTLIIWNRYNGQETEN